MYAYALRLVGCHNSNLKAAPVANWRQHCSQLQLCFTHANPNAGTEQIQLSGHGSSFSSLSLSHLLHATRIRRVDTAAFGVAIKATAAQLTN